MYASDISHFIIFDCVYVSFELTSDQKIYIFMCICFFMYVNVYVICICSRSFHPDRVLHALTLAPLILAVYMAVYVSVLSHRIRNYAELYVMAFLYPLIIDLTS